MGGLLTLFRPPLNVQPGDDWSRRLGGMGWRVLDTLIRHAAGDSLTLAEVATLAGMGERTARRWLRVLAAEGVARSLGVGGPGRGRKERWTLEPGMPEALQWRPDWRGLADAGAHAFAADRDAFLGRLAPAWTEIDHDTGEVRAHPALVERGSTQGRFALARAARVRRYGDGGPDEDDDAEALDHDDEGNDVGEGGT